MSSIEQNDSKSKNIIVVFAVLNAICVRSLKKWSLGPVYMKLFLVVFMEL